MIPCFPKFKRLAFADRSAIEKYTKRYPPYSDFDFVSLWGWSSRESTLVSILNNNLVLKFRDYITHEPFYTFIGINRIANTIDMLLKKAQEDHLSPCLKIIPEVSLQTAPKSVFSKYSVCEDRDNFDYIYSVNRSIEFNGNKLRSKRNFVNRFKSKYQFTHKIIDLSSSRCQEEMLQLYEIWRKAKIKDPMEVQNELGAIKRVFKCQNFRNFLVVGLYIDQQLAGFSINEIHNHGYTTNLFEKGNIKFEGIFPYLRQITATYLAQKGCQFLNHEQDLGVEGLRKSKLSYCPKFFLKKYTISLKNDQNVQ